MIYRLYFHPQIDPITGLIPISGGGTGADTAAGARTNLGLGTIATQDASNVAITGGTIGIAPHPNYISGNWYWPPSQLNAASGVIPTGTIRLLPVYIPRSMIVADIAMQVVLPAAGGMAKIALYANNSTTNRPTGAALIATGDLSTAATGPVAGGLALSVAVPAGFYWMAIQADTTASAGNFIPTTYSGNYAVVTNYIGTPTLALIATTNGITCITLTVAQAYGAFPDLTAASFSEVTSNIGAVILLKHA